MTYSISNNIIENKTETETALINENTKAIYLLNETASYIWEGIKSKQTEAEMMSTLCNKYELSEKDSLQDIRELTEQLASFGLIAISKNKH